LCLGNFLTFEHYEPSQTKPNNASISDQIYETITKDPIRPYMLVSLELLESVLLLIAVQLSQKFVFKVLSSYQFHFMHILGRTISAM